MTDLKDKKENRKICLSNMWIRKLSLNSLFVLHFNDCSVCANTPLKTFISRVPAAIRFTQIISWIVFHIFPYCLLFGIQHLWVIAISTKLISEIYCLFYSTFFCFLFSFSVIRSHISLNGLPYLCIHYF